MNDSGVAAQGITEDWDEHTGQREGNCSEVCWFVPIKDYKPEEPRYGDGNAKAMQGLVEHPFSARKVVVHLRGSAGAVGQLAADRVSFGRYGTDAPQL